MLLINSIITVFCFIHFGEATNPHIVFILADDLGWGDVGYHGSLNIDTPNIDRLAAAGVKLENYYVQPICTPTRSALLTGKYPIYTGTQEGVIQHTEPWGIDLNEKLLSTYMKEKGYRRHIVGKWHLGFFEKEYTPIYRDFESFFGFYNSGSDYETHYSSIRRSGTLYEGLDLHRDVAPDTLEPDLSNVGVPYYSSKMYAQEASTIIANHDTSKTDEPLFLYLPLQSVHGPLQAASDCEDRFAGMFTSDPLRKTMAAMLACMDDAVGEIEQALIRNNRMIDNTIIIFSSDNGGKARADLSSNYPLRGEKGTLYEGGVRVPAFISSPLLANPGTSFTDLMHVTDWLPTLVKLTGNTYPTTLDGKDQWDRIQNVAGAVQARDTILLNYRGNQEALIHQDSDGVTWKIIQDDTNMSDDTWQEPSENDVTNAICGGKSQPSTPPDCRSNHCLFNLSDDPCEYENVRHSSVSTRRKYRDVRDLLDEYKNEIHKAIVPSRKQGEENALADPSNFMYTTAGGVSVPVWMPWRN